MMPPELLEAERARFEKWLAEHMNDDCPRWNGKDGYRDHETEMCWQGWKARAFEAYLAVKGVLL